MVEGETKIPRTDCDVYDLMWVGPVLQCRLAEHTMVDTEAVSANLSNDTVVMNATTLPTMMAVSDNNNVSEECKVNVSEMTAHEVFGLFVPNNDSDIWEQRTDAWYAFFYIMLVVYIVLFLGLAAACALLLAKRHLVERFKRVRTFIAIDIALMILGISRALFLILDPFGQIGFCSGSTPCIIISRLIKSLGFPSLTASYTLVFITLWASARLQLGRSWIQKVKILAPLCGIHYVVAILFEIVGSLPVGNSMFIVSLLLFCEAIFSMWGFTVCFAFLFAGHRLLKSVERSARSSSRICRDSPNMTRHDLIEKSKFQNRGHEGRMQSTLKLKHMLKKHHKQAVRKVTRITYITVVLGMLYSTLSILNLLLAVLTVFDGCPGLLFGRRQLPELWLTFRYLFFMLELGLAVLLTYSISDYRPLINFLKQCCCLKKVDSRKPTPDIPDSSTGSVDTIGTQVKKNPPVCMTSPIANIHSTADNEKNKIRVAETDMVSSISKESDDSIEGQVESSPPTSPLRNARVTVISNVAVTTNGHIPKSPSPLTVTFSLSDELKPQ